MTQDELFWNFVCKFQLPPSLVQVVRSFLSDSAWQFWFPFHTWVFGKIDVFPHWNVCYEDSLLILRRAFGHEKSLWRRLWRSRCRGTLYFNVDTLVECAWNIRLRSFLGGVGVKSLMRTWGVRVKKRSLSIIDGFHHPLCFMPVTKSKNWPLATSSITYTRVPVWQINTATLIGWW